MMNRLKLLFLSLLTPLLCLGVSFGANVGGNAGTLITALNLCNGGGNLNGVGDYDLLCFSPQNGSDFQNVEYITVYNQNDYSIAFGVRPLSISPFCFLTNGASSYYVSTALNVNGLQECNAGTNSSQYSFDIYGYSLGGGGNSNCESDLEYLSGKYASLDSAYNSLNNSYSALSGNYANCLEAKGILSGQLATCNSDLSSCTNSCDSLVSQCQVDKNACLERYNTCTGDLLSMTNYNESLSTQLNECLAELPVPCEGTGCDEIVSGLDVVFSFFWENEGNMFSLPIGNNVFLPQGYRAYVDSGVVAITEIDKRKIKIDEGSYVLNETYYSFIMGIIMLLIFSLFAYYMKKFISKFFIPKETKG